MFHCRVWKSHCTLGIWAKRKQVVSIQHHLDPVPSVIGTFARLLMYTIESVDSKG